MREDRRRAHIRFDRSGVERPPPLPPGCRDKLGERRFKPRRDVNAKRLRLIGKARGDADVQRPFLRFLP